MKNIDLIELLFDKLEDEDIFNLKDDLLEELNDQIEIDNNQLNIFIDRRVHPKSRFILKNLIEKAEDSLVKYNSRENQLYYKNGIKDGINLMLNLLYFK